MRNLPPTGRAMLSAITNSAPGRKLASWGRAYKQSLTPRDVPACHRSREENWNTMRLLKRTVQIDDLGRWWVIEIRQCQYTGLRIERTRRICD